MSTSWEQAWNELLPGHPRLGKDLLGRWSQDSRHYHGLTHLSECLAALRRLGEPQRTEELALWFHDAIHTNTPGSDEIRSAELAETVLESILPQPEITEISRLIRLTINHEPRAHDQSGARVCDADLAILAASPARYEASVAQLRAELPAMPTAEWMELRRTRLQQLLAAAPLFHSPIAHQSWTPLALSNLRNEFQRLQSW